MGCQIQPRTDTTPAPEMQIIPNPSAATKVALDNPHPLDFAVAAAHNAHHRVLAEELPHRRVIVASAEVLQAVVVGHLSGKAE